MSKPLLEVLQTYGDPDLGYPDTERLYEISPDIDDLLEKLLTTEIMSPTKQPLGHLPVPDKPRYYIPDPSVYVKYIQAMFGNRYSKSYSLNQLKANLEAKGFSISSNGQLGNIFNKVETRLKLKDKRSAVKKKIDAYVALTGKSKGPTHSKLGKANLTKANKVNTEKAKLRIAEQEVINAKRRLVTAAKKDKMTAAELREFKKRPPERKLHGGTLETEVPKELEVSKELEVPEGKKVLYEPTERQALFHAAGENIVLYGGAAGGGKSYAMLVDALRYCMYEDYRALIIRKTSPMLKELIGVSRQLYPKAFPGATYNKSENVWYFPSGATIEFGYLDKEEDLERYQGMPYAYIGFDEIQHQRGPEGFLYLMSRNRSANPLITCYMRASANPGGASWVKEMFIDPAEPGNTFWNNGLSYKFIPAKLADNKYLDRVGPNGEISAYRKMLLALPEVKRKQLLEGDWNAGEDSMFQFRKDTHVTYDLPPFHWNVINSLDYGFKDPAASLWGAVDPHTGQIIVYDELEVLGKPVKLWGQEIREREGYVAQHMERVIDHTVFNNHGHTGPGVREELRYLGITPKPADRNREAGWNQIHSRLEPNESGIPMLLVHHSCVKLIDQLETAKTHKLKPDDLDDGRVTSKGRKHHWDLLDTLRYMLMARPQRDSFAHRSIRYKQESQGFDRYRNYFS